MYKYTSVYTQKYIYIYIHITHLILKTRLSMR